MLLLQTEKQEMYDETKNLFVYLDGKSYRFEHSLKAISDWESVYKKPFMSSEQKTNEELLDYICMMNLDKNFNISELSHTDLAKVTEYISDSQSATSIKPSGKSNNAITTSEVVYAYMAMASIPFECDTWNFNRLMNLLQVYGDLQQPKKKMSQTDVMRQNRELNEARRQKLKSKG